VRTAHGAVLSIKPTNLVDISWLLVQIRFRYIPARKVGAQKVQSVWQLCCPCRHHRQGRQGPLVRQQPHTLNKVRSASRLKMKTDGGCSSKPEERSDSWASMCLLRLAPLPAAALT